MGGGGVCCCRRVACAGGRRWRAGLSHAAHSPGGAVSAGIRNRHRGAAAGAAHERRLAPAGVRREPGGAGATTGVASVAKAEPDGHTILMADLGPLAMAPSFYRQLAYDPVKDLVPITQVAVLPFLLVGHPAVPARSVSELVALAKAKPGELNYASVGNGTAVHLATELFRQRAGIDVVHVPYKGSAPALTDLVAGRTSMMFVNVLSARSFVESGQLRALAIGTAQRSAVMPAVPTVAETGMPGFQAVVWFGLLAPAATPQPIVDRLNAVAAKHLATPDFKQKLAEQAAEAVPSTPQQFSALIKAEIETWASVIRAAGVQPD